MTAIERVARMLFDDQYASKAPELTLTERQLDGLWTELQPHFLDRARRYLNAAIEEALDPEIAWQRQSYGSAGETDKAAVGRLIGMQDAAEALRRNPS